MTLVPYDINKVIERKNANLFKVLEDFHGSEYNCMKVEDYPHKNANCCASCLRAAIKRYKLFSIKVSVRGNDVILIK